VTAPSAARRTLIALGLWLFVFGIECGLARQFHVRQVLSSVDTLFNADAGWFLIGFADGHGTGTSWGARSMIHPNVANWVNPPVRLAAHLCTVVVLCDTPAEVARRQVGASVAPALAATESVLLFAAAWLMFRTPLLAVLAAALNAALFPSVIFGALPESYALSGCAFAALFYLVSRHSASLAVGPAAWIAVGVLLAGITITNLVPFVLIVAFVQLHATGSLRHALMRTVRWSVTAVVVTVVVAVAITSAYGSLDDFWSGPVKQRVEIHISRYRPGTESFAGYTRRQLRKILPRAAVAFPVALGNTLLPGLPSVRDGAEPGKPARQSFATAPDVPHALSEVTYERSGATWSTALSLIAIAGAVWCALFLPHPNRLVYQAAALLLAYNWAFHSVFGTELFLYAKHWTVGVTVLLWAWMHLTRPIRKAGAVVIGVLIVAGVARGIQALQWILQLLP
jgi:hypothetical protein